MDAIPDLPENLSKKQLSEIQDLFNLFDIDGNGSICKKEFRIVMKSLGHHLTDEDAGKLIKVIKVFHSIVEWPL